MGWRDDLTVGDFVIVDRFDSWTTEVVTRETAKNVWTSRRDGGEERFTRSWGRAVGERGGVLAQWTPTTKANLKERDERMAAQAKEEARREAHWRKSRRILQIDWLALPDETLDAVLRLAEVEAKP
jgi:hypothetical protein